MSGYHFQDRYRKDKLQSVYPPRLCLQSVLQKKKGVFKGVFQGFPVFFLFGRLCFGVGFRQYIQRNPPLEFPSPSVSRAVTPGKLSSA